MTKYSFSALNATLTMSVAFAKKAQHYGTPEYNTLMQLRRDWPELKLEMESAHAASRSGLTFKQMEDFISKCENADKRKAEFATIKALSKVQVSPYSYVKKWFENHYANYAMEPVFDENGYVIVKTKAQLEEEQRKVAASKEEKDDSIVSMADYVAKNEQAI